MSENLTLPQSSVVEGTENALPFVALHDPHSVERLLALGRTQLGMEVAFVSEFIEGRAIVRSVAGDADAFDLQAGGSSPLFDSYCWRVANGSLPNIIADATAYVRTHDLDVTRDADIGSYIGVPIRVADGRVGGSLCCLSRSPNPALGEPDVEFLNMLAALMAQDLEAQWAAHSKRIEAVERIRGVLERGGLGVVFRPIFDLGSLSIVGYEALARFQDGRSPTRWFAEAAAIGLGPDLERAAKQIALAHLDDLPSWAYLWVNLSPSAVGSSTVREMLAAVPGDRIIVGLTPTRPEHAQRMERAVSDLRACGFRVAIDQVDGESPALSDIIGLGPDALRLDVEAVRAAATDPKQRDVLSFLAGLASGIGAVLVADGIETRRTLDCLRDLGVAYGQGYALAPPLAPRDVPHEEP
jgi:EAL domain-containing protein (putative c-di-GMP-specific phosphodiesterase class I)